MTVSVIVITKNEAPVIRRCLASVAWADEIIVVDSGSTDGTADICRSLGANVWVTPDWPGFGAQKNRALAMATQTWVLSLDADEWLTARGQEELRATLERATETCGFRFPRRSRYCGRFLSHGGWYPDYVVRLFRRDRGHFTEDRVHERVVVEGPVATLATPLLHESYRDLEEVLTKINDYSTGGAQRAYETGRRGSLPIALGRGLWAFFRTYVMRLGLLDGAEGLMLAISNAETTYYKYLKLAFLARQKDPASAPPKI